MNPLKLHVKMLSIQEFKNYECVNFSTFWDGGSIGLEITQNIPDDSQFGFSPCVFRLYEVEYFSAR